MKSEKQDIEMLELAILTEAREEAGQLQVEAKQKADAIHKRAQEQALQDRRSILETRATGRGASSQPGYGDRAIESAFFAVGASRKNS